MDAHCVLKVMRKRGREGGETRRTGGKSYIRVTKAEEFKKKKIKRF